MWIVCKLGLVELLAASVQEEQDTHDDDEYKDTSQREECQYVLGKILQGSHAIGAAAD